MTHEERQKRIEEDLREIERLRAEDNKETKDVKKIRDKSPSKREKEDNRRGKDDERRSKDD